MPRSGRSFLSKKAFYSQDTVSNRNNFYRTCEIDISYAS